MDTIAQQLATLLNQLAWPEVGGTYSVPKDRPSVVRNSDFSVAFSDRNRIAMFCEESHPGCYDKHKFVAVPTDPGVDIPAWLATEFLHWATTETA